MLIILEGADGAGKTTLARKLADRIVAAGADPPRMLTRGPLKPDQDPVAEYTLDLDGYRPGTREHVICDRWHLGELVYGPLKRDGSRLTPGCRWYIDAFIAARGGLVVYVAELLDVLAHRVRERGDDFIDVPELSPITKAYEEVLHDSYAPLVRVIPSVQDSAVEAIIRGARTANEYATPLAAFPSYVGPPRPGILLLGERRGPRNVNGHRSAFVPYLGTSGRYLCDALQFEQRRYALANACEENLEELYSVAAPMTVVALGHAAHQAASNAAIPHGSVPHPQFWRRFVHNRPRQYVSLINHVAVTKENLISWRPS